MTKKAAAAPPPAAPDISELLDGRYGRLVVEAAQEALGRAWGTAALDDPAALGALINRVLLKRFGELLVECDGNLAPRIDDATALIAAITRNLA
jgi:hypothetical protein